MRGIIIFLRTFFGTKSESLQPFLYLGGGDTVRLRMDGDNPFENESLRPYDGKEVVVEGVLDEDNVLEIECLSCIADVDSGSKFNVGFDNEPPPSAPFSRTDKHYTI